MIGGMFWPGLSNSSTNTALDGYISSRGYFPSFALWLFGLDFQMILEMLISSTRKRRRWWGAELPRGRDIWGPIVSIGRKYTSNSEIRNFTSGELEMLWLSFFPHGVSSGLIQFCQDILLYGFSTFLPSILRAMKYDTLQSNYLTIPVYIWGAIIFLSMAWVSDRWSIRGPVSILGLTF